MESLIVLQTWKKTESMGPFDWNILFRLAGVAHMGTLDRKSVRRLGLASQGSLTLCGRKKSWWAAG
jgi:hypothetical protein